MMRVEQSPGSAVRPWLPAVGHALPVAGLVLALFYYWFAVADRYAVFLYNHLGATPFDAVTRSRYWMSGLVAAGAVLVLYTFLAWLAGRLSGLWNRSYRPPAAWQVWLMTVLPLTPGILTITTRLNQPTLPLPLALACLAAGLGGLALALLPASLAAQRPVELAWLTLHGAGLVPILLLLRVIELPARGLVSPVTALGVTVGSSLVSLTWLAGMTALALRLHRPLPSARALLLAALCLSYLLLPLLHHLFTPPQWRYISTASNFFAFSFPVQVLTGLVAVSLAVAVTWLGRRFRP